MGCLSSVFFFLAALSAGSTKQLAWVFVVYGGVSFLFMLANRSQIKRGERPWFLPLDYKGDKQLTWLVSVFLAGGFMFGAYLRESSGGDGHGMAMGMGISAMGGLIVWFVKQRQTLKRAQENALAPLYEASREKVGLNWQITLHYRPTGEVFTVKAFTQNLAEGQVGDKRKELSASWRANHPEETERQATDRALQGIEITAEDFSWWSAVSPGKQNLVGAVLLLFLSWSSISMGEREQTPLEKHIEERTPAEERANPRRQSMLYGLVHSGDKKAPEKAVEEKPVKKDAVVYDIKRFKGWDVKRTFETGGGAQGPHPISVIRLTTPSGFEVAIGSDLDVLEDGLVVERRGFKKVGPELSVTANVPGDRRFYYTKDRGFYKIKFKVLDDGALRFKINAKLLSVGNDDEMRINATGVLRPN